jgi:ABC transporter substrate binding protein
MVPLTQPQTVTFCAMTVPSICAPSPIRRSEARTSPLIWPKTCAGPLHSLAAGAQQPAKVPTIGFLGATTPAGGGQLLAAFVQRLRELGWVDARNVAIEVRWAEGRSERFAEIAAELIRLKVDVILTHNTPPVLAAKEATSVIPIVFASAGDPVGSGVVASLARPGGNVTGLSAGSPDVVGQPTRRA